MITRSAARMPATTLVTDTTKTQDFAEPVTADLVSISPIHGGSIGVVKFMPLAPNFISGTSGSDDLFGTSADDFIKGLGGKDFLYGLDGNDTLDGGLGADVMAGGKGDDIYYVDEAGPAGDRDVIFEWAGEGTDTVVLDSVSGQNFSLPTAVENLVLAGSVQFGFANELDNVITGNAADNTVYGYGGNDTIAGGYGNDRLYGDNDVFGRYGNDTIDGGFGNDVLVGERGNDQLFGGGDYDILDGGAGQDTLTGGSGGDTFVWQSTAETSLAGQEADVVTDFNRASGDVLDVKNIDANVAVAGDQAFTFAGIVNVSVGQSFTAPGQIGYFTTATDTYILLNTEVDAGIDYQDATIRVAGVHTVDASWFVL